MSSHLLDKCDTEFRAPGDIVAYWQDAQKIDPRFLEFRTAGEWWETLANLQIVLLVTREYEHLILALGTNRDLEPDVSFIRLPHPSGVAVDIENQSIYVASTRNPNQIFDFMPISSLMPRLDMNVTSLEKKPLVPVRTRLFPGCLYLHDLAIIDQNLYANSVGQNAVVRLDRSGFHERVWWPKCIETSDGPIFGRNHLQLNSIAAGETLRESFFSSSTAEITNLCPGDPSFPVDKQGVIFSGQSREPVVRGLTRPHSARLFGGKLWIDNSGYGEVGSVEGEYFHPVTRLSGWTRGLCCCENTIFVGTSRVLPRFRGYAPGLDLNTSICGVHAVDARSGRTVGSIIWPDGTQIFAVDWFPRKFADGFPFRAQEIAGEKHVKDLFYAFQMSVFEEG